MMMFYVSIIGSDSSYLLRELQVYMRLQPKPINQDNKRPTPFFHQDNLTDKYGLSPGLEVKKHDKLE